MSATTTEAPVVPAIVCPPWCQITTAEHVADLPRWDGFVIHWSAELHGKDGCSVRVSEGTEPDGTLDHLEPGFLWLANPENLTADVAIAFGSAVIEASRMLEWRQA